MSALSPRGAPTSPRALPTSPRQDIGHLTVEMFHPSEKDLQVKTFSFSVKVWVPLNEASKCPWKYQETLFPFQGKPTKLWVDPDRFLSQCHPLRQLGITIEERQFVESCKSNELERFVYRIIQRVRWRKFLLELGHPEELIAKFTKIIQHHCPKQPQRTFIQLEEGCSVDYLEDGSIWLHFSDATVVDLESGKRFRTLVYQGDDEKKMMLFSPLLANQKGIVPAIQVFSREDDLSSYCIAAYPSYEFTLDQVGLKLNLPEKIAVAIQLLDALEHLEKGQIIHYGIAPNQIFLQPKEKSYEAFLFNWLKIDFISKWPLEQQAEAPAIPVLQLGECLQPLFTEDFSEVQLIIKGMCHPNPKERWTVSQAKDSLNSFRKSLRRKKELLHFCGIKEPLGGELIGIIYENIPDWSKENWERISVVLPKGYSVDYCRDGSIWFYYVYTCELLEMKHSSFTVELSTREIRHVMEYYEKAEYEKVVAVSSQVQGQEGFVSIRDALVRELKSSSYTVTFDLCDLNLFSINSMIMQGREKSSRLERSRTRTSLSQDMAFDAVSKSQSTSSFSESEEIEMRPLRGPSLRKINFSDKLKMAIQLLKGLEFLETTGLIHCHIEAREILVRFQEDGFHAFITNYSDLYPADQLPSKISRFSEEYIPPECRDVEHLNQLSHPRAIAVYQLAICFELLFKEELRRVTGILDGMLDPDPSTRWPAARVREALSGLLSASQISTGTPRASSLWEDTKG